jgi:oxygen-independent coproporphyrinogen-3 oxidase
MDAFGQQVIFDEALIGKYNQQGPRYTSYPTAPHFQETFTPEVFARHLRGTRREGGTAPRDLSLYVHIPFCDTPCYYCACNRIITTDRSKADRYIDSLLREIDLVADALGEERRRVVQIHFGGGTPTYLDSSQFDRIWNKFRERFILVEDAAGEYSVEMDPRELLPDAVSNLRRTGFNRLSVGVQDIDPQVQKAVNRVQPLELSRQVIAEARSVGFCSVNLDLIYGLPFQNESSFSQSLERIVTELDPDRLAVFNYAHLPQYFPAQRRINETDLPTADEKLRILKRTIEWLTGAGYVYIGMDHFAKPGDELAVAQRAGRLHRNFQGYTLHGDCDLIAFGVTAISQFGACYAQNVKTLAEYYETIDSGRLATFRGYELSAEDMIRRKIIMDLMCQFRIDRAAIGQWLGIPFGERFQHEETLLREMVSDGLLEEQQAREKQVLHVTPVGRLLVRNVGMVFDWYLHHAEQKKKFSRTI